MASVPEKIDDRFTGVRDWELRLRTWTSPASARTTRAVVMTAQMPRNTCALKWPARI